MRVILEGGVPNRGDTVEREWGAVSVFQTDAVCRPGPPQPWYSTFGVGSFFASHFDRFGNGDNDTTATRRRYIVERSL